MFTLFRFCADRRCDVCLTGMFIVERGTSFESVGQSVFAIEQESYHVCCQLGGDSACGILITGMQVSRPTQRHCSDN